MTGFNNERWLPVVGFEGLYDVSSFGRVRRSLTARGPGSTPGRIRSLWTSSTTGYPETVLYLPPRIPYRRTVHSLAAEAFLGPCPPGMEVLHGDGDRTNNVLGNLRYGTRSENHRQAYADGRAVAGNAGRLGEANAAAKLTADGVRAIRATFRPGRSGNAQELAARFNVSATLIRSVANRKIWRHVRDAEKDPS